MCIRHFVVSLCGGGVLWSAPTLNEPWCTIKKKNQCTDERSFGQRKNVGEFTEDLACYCCNQPMLAEPLHLHHITYDSDHQLGLRVTHLASKADINPGLASVLVLATTRRRRGLLARRNNIAAMRDSTTGDNTTHTTQHPARNRATTKTHNNKLDVQPSACGHGHWRSRCCLPWGRWSCQSYQTSCSG